MSTKLPRGTLDKLWNDPAHWHSPSFYCCKEDPRIIVPKRRKWAGWTLNFAHTAAWFNLCSGVVLAVVPTWLLSKCGNLDLLYLWIVILIIISIVMGRIQSSPDKYEEP